MLANKPHHSSLSRDGKKAKLRRLKKEHQRLLAYMAIYQYNLEEQRTDKDDSASEVRVPKRALARREGARRSRDERIRKQGEDSELLEPPATSLPTPSQGKALDRKIASYKDRIRRTSMQLLVALAAGSQSTDPEIQSRQSHSTTVTSSTSNSTDGDNNEIPISAMAQTIGAQTSSTSSRGDWADEIAAPIMDKYMKRVFLSGAGQAQPSSPKAGDLNTGKPSNAPDPSVYDSRLWKRLEYTDDAAWLNKNSVFEQPKDHTPEGWATWKTQEKTYPSLAVILGRQKVDMDKLWDPDQRSLEEKKRAQHGRAGSGHPHLEPSSITLLSLERRIGFERREMNPLYRHYSQVPVSLPARVSDEDMSHGHIKTPPPLPLEAPSGYKVSLAPKLDPNPSEVETARRKRLRISRKDMGPVPEAQYDYPTDLPANPTFKFSGGRGVADFAKLNPIDETRHVRGSQQIRDAGEIMAAQEAPFVEPYTFEGKMPPQPPGFKMPPLVKRSREERDKAEAELAAKRKEFHEGMLGKLQARGHSFDPHDPFWHYEGGEDSQGNVGTTLPHPPNTPIADGEEPQEDIATNNPSNVTKRAYSVALSRYNYEARRYKQEKEEAKKAGHKVPSKPPELILAQRNLTKAESMVKGVVVNEGTNSEVQEGQPTPQPEEAGKNVDKGRQNKRVRFDMPE